MPAEQTETVNATDETVKDAKVEAPVTSPEQTQTPETQKQETVEGQSQGSVAPKETEKKPFHEDPEVQKYLDRQWRSRERKLNDGFEQRIKSVEDRYVNQLEAMTRRDPKAEMPEEQSKALEDLAVLFSKSPNAMKSLGLDQMQTLAKENESFRTAFVQDQFNAEKAKVLDSAVKNGMDRAIVEEEMSTFIEESSFYSDKEYTKGTYQSAFRDLYFDRIGEIKERAVNLKHIKEQKEKHSANSQQPSPGQTQTGHPQETSIRDFVTRRVRESGGVTM